MKNLAYYNGKIGLAEEMTVPFLDRVSFFGDGVYDAAYSRNYNIYALGDHIDRFFYSAALLGININETKESLSRLLCSLVQKLEDGEQFVYFQATRGTGPRSHDYDPSSPANLWVMLTPKKVADTYKKIRLITVEDTRYFHCNIKTLNLIPNVLAAHQASAAGCGEAVFYRGGRVTECAHSNVSIIKDGELLTAPADELILPGIARAHLLKEARAQGIAVRERPFTVDELKSADEIIVTSSGSFCVAAEMIDGSPAGGRAPLLLRSLQDALVNDFLEKTNLMCRATNRPLE